MRELRDEVKRRLAGARIDPARALDIVEEIAQDLEERYAELLRQGVPATEARSAVLDELDGHDVLAREIARVERQLWPAVVPGAPRRGLAGDLWSDLRYGVRALLKSPAFTAVTLLSLALGIGANTAIFQMLDTLHLRRLPVADPDRLVDVKIRDMSGASGDFNGGHPDLSNPLWERIRDEQQAFQSVLAWGEGTFNLASTGEQRPARGLYVSGSFFATLGVPPLLGRVLTAADDRRGCGAPGAVVSHAFWQRELGGDPSAVGRTLSLHGHVVEILGVTPPSFFGLDVGRSFDVAVPICMDALIRGDRSRLDVRHSWWLSVVGRLNPGWSVERASAHVDALSKGVFEATVPASYNRELAEKYRAFRLGATPAGTGISGLRQQYSEPLYFLLATAGLVLLIACANLANLLLARASAREREIAVRLALGASRGRLIRQLMTESLLLAVLGAALGLLLAGTLSQLLVSLISTPGSPLFVDLTPDWRVLGFTVGLAVLTCLLFGLAPALRASRTDVGLVLKATGGHGATGAWLGLRRMLVAAQLALSFVLLVGALLFARSLGNLAAVDPGFNAHGVFALGADMRRLELPVDRRAAAQADVLAHVRNAPGVAAAASASIVPISGSGWNHDVSRDAPENRGKEGLDTYFSSVSSGYFSTMGTPFVAGRDFGPVDNLGSPRVGIVNQTLSRRIFGAENPVGQKLLVAPSSVGEAWTIEIIGVVKDTKYGDLREEFRPLVFVAATQDKTPFARIDMLIRPARSVAEAVESAKRAVAEVSPLITVEVDLLEQVIRDSLLRERLMATLSGFFGLLAGILASIGLYGVVSYSVARRTHEIGIRMALGADRRHIARLIVGETAVLLAIGLGAGVLLALAATRAAASMLYGLRPHDPLTFVVAVALLATVTLIAAALPARRAAGVDPMIALREE